MPNLIGVAPTFPSYAVPEPSMASPKTMKHKTDDCTTLRGRPSVAVPPSVHSIPNRHQTCRAENSRPAHLPDKSARSAEGITKRYRSSRLLRSRPHRCPPSDFGPVRLGDFFRAAYSVPPPHSLRPGPPVIQAPLRALCSEIPKTHGRSSERQRCSLRSRADREFTRLPESYSQAYI